MRKLCVFMASALILASPVLSAVGEQETQASGKDSPEACYRAVAGAPVTLSSEVRNLKISRDAATFVFKSGWIDVMEPFRDRYHTAVFRGDGLFRLTPPTPVEAAQLKKFTGREKLEEPFHSVVLRFTDNTIEEILKACRLEPTISDMGAEGARLCQQSKDRILKDHLQNIDSRILCDLHSGKQGYFLADISSKSLGDFLFEIDPRAREEVSLVQHKETRGEFIDIWCSFHLTDQYEGTRPVRDRPVELIQIPHFEVDLTLDKKGKVKATADIDCVALEGPVTALRLNISQYVEVDEIKDEHENPCFYVHEIARDKVGEPPLRQQHLVVCLPSPILNGETRRLTVRYHSDKLIRKAPEKKEYVIQGSTSWYPNYGYLQRATSKCTYRVPRDLNLIAVGRKDKEWEEGGLACSTWVQDVPVAFVCFNMGEFEHKRIKVEGLPPADVYIGKHHVGITLGGDVKHNVAADMLNSLNFFQQVFGPYPFPRIVASEIPGGWGQGFPGFLHLARGTFQDWSMGIDESFRAHEVSHQWWGHVVGWETYHDQWLSEGFAEYSGALFAHMTLKGKKKDLLFKMVENWRNDILHKGNLSFERYGMPKLPRSYTMGSDSGPLWLGYRLSSSKSPIDYQILVYEKGAYVLHMLRMMMKDFNTNSDEKFLSMIKDFVKTYTWKDATTEGFRRIAEKHMNMDLEWFFSQWVYGTAIPTYRFKHRLEVGENGKEQLVCEVEQSGVPEGFKMPVPVKIDFGKDRFAIVRLPITKAREIFRMNLPSSPRKVEFNYYHSVLCYTE